MANVQLTNVAPIYFSTTQSKHPTDRLPDDLCNSTLQAENTTNYWFPRAGTFYVCGTIAYPCLPANWMGVCSPAYLTPDLFIIPNNKFLETPL